MLIALRLLLYKILMLRFMWPFYSIAAGTESDVDSEPSVTNFVVHQRTTTIPSRGRKRGRPPKVCVLFSFRNEYFEIFCNIL